jgi:DNA repair protein RecO (recombination protein O)
MLQRVEGIVIRSLDYGEGNKIISIYTKEIGKISVMVRGAKKAKSRHSAITQLFTYGEFVFFKSSGMGTLNDGEIIQSHHSIRENIVLAAYAAYLSELIDRMMGESEGSSFLFNQIAACLEALEDGKDPQIVMHLFEMKILHLAGYSPVLDQCAVCAESTDNPVLGISSGGILCSKCAHREASPMAVSEKALKLLRLFLQMDIRRLGKIEVSLATKSMLKKFMRDFFDAHIDVRLKSRAFLDQMEKHNMI